MCSINREKKVAFFHIMKNCGIFIRENLQKYYGFENYLCVRDDHIEFCGTNMELNKGKQLTFCSSKGVYNYYATSIIINQITEMTPELWKEYLKFCFCRNPYDRVVSAYNYIMETEKLNIDFDVYLEMKDIVTENEYAHVFLSQKQHVIDSEGNCVMDFIGRFENFEDDFKLLLEKIGIDKIIHNPKPKNKREHGSYKKYYDNRLIKIVNDLFMEDFEFFGYNMVNCVEEMELLNC